MATFQRPETVVIKGTVKDEDDVLTTPGTSTQITITDPAGTEVETDENVTFDSVGIWRFLHTPDAAAVLGAYYARVTAIDGGLSSIADSQFILVG